MINQLSIKYNNKINNYFFIFSMDDTNKIEQIDNINDPKQSEAEAALEMESNWDETVETFDELNLKKDLLRGIYGYGFEKPSHIQQKAILPIIRGRDTIAQAQSGTGKTATFAISSLQLVDVELHEVQALILAPTRELAQQISVVNIKISKKYLLIGFRFDRRISQG